MKGCVTLQVLLSASALLLSSSAMAQATADAAGRPSETVTSAESPGDIVVTARRREESLQSVPVTIAAFSSNTLTQKNVTKLQDISQVVPGLTAQATQQGSAALTLSIRGQRQALTNIAYESPVAVYQDEVLISRPQGLNQSFYDIANVQVIKGPQGTLFGRNATGGAVLITSQKPTDRFEGYISGNLGNYGLVSGQAALNVPLSDAFQLRVAGAAISRGGDIDNPVLNRKVGNERAQSWRVSLRTVLDGGRIENILIGTQSHQNQDGTVYKAIGAVAGSNAARITGPDLAFYATQPFRTVTSNIPADGTHNLVTGLTDTATIDLGGTKIRNIFGYRRIRNHQFYDISGQRAFFLDAQQDFVDRQWSDELQILGTALKGKLDYIAGLYYFYESGSEVQLTRVGSTTSGTNGITDYNLSGRSFAGYLQGTWHATDRLSLTAGVRYSHDERQFEQRAHFVNGTCRILTADIGGAPLVPCVKDADATFNKPTYTLSADWKFDDRNMIYFTHRYGYQAGGFTNSALKPSEFLPYDPQTVKDYEIGLKTSWSVGNISGRTNLAGYRGDYKGIQRLFTFSTVDANGNVFFTNRIQNAASAVVQGVEFDQHLDFGQGLLTVDVAYAFTDAHYTKFFVAGVDYTKSKLSGTPRNTVSAAARLRLPVPDSLAVTHFQLSGSYQSASITQDISTFDPVAQVTRLAGTIPGFTLLNARLDMEDIGGMPLRVSLWVRNLADKDYYVAGSDGTASIGLVTRILGAPRTFGVEASYRF